MKQVIFIMFILVSILTNAQPPKKFFCRYGSGGYEVGNDVKQTLDNGYIITGSTSSFGQGNTDMYLLKLDSMGQKKFEVSFGGYSNEVGKSIVQLSDSSYVIVGYTSSSGFGGYDVFLVKADKAGSLIWQKTIGGADWDFANSIQQTTDGGFIIAGTTYSYGRGNADGYIIKTDAGGNVTWSKTYGGKKDDEFKSVIQTTDGNYALTGYTKSYADSLSDVWAFKIDVNGDSLWCKFHGGNKEDFGNEIIEHPNGEFYIAGGSKSYGSGVTDGYIVQLNNMGNYNFKQIDNTSTTFQEFTSIVISKRSQNIVNAIAKETFAAYGLQSKMLEMNSTLNFINAIDYGSVQDDQTYKLITTKDKGYACIGYTYGYNAILSDCYFVKVDSNLVGSLNSIVSVNEFSHEDMQVDIYPNPTSNVLNIRSTLKINSKELKLYDCIGKEILIDDKIKSDTKFNLVLNIEELSSGIYYLKYLNRTEKISVFH